MSPRNHHLKKKNHRPFHKASNSKIQRIQDILAKESEVIFFKKIKRKRKKRSPLSIPSCKLWSSNKFKWEAIHSIHSIPSKNPMFHETWIWPSTDPILDHPSVK